MKAIFLMMIIATFMMGGSQVWAEDVLEGNDTANSFNPTVVKAPRVEGEQDVPGVPGAPIVCDHKGKEHVNPTTSNTIGVVTNQ